MAIGVNLNFRFDLLQFIVIKYVLKSTSVLYFTGVCICTTKSSVKPIQTPTVNLNVNKPIQFINVRDPLILVSRNLSLREQHLRLVLDLFPN